MFVPMLYFLNYYVILNQLYIYIINVKCTKENWIWRTFFLIILHNLTWKLRVQEYHNFVKCVDIDKKKFYKIYLD